MGRQRIRMSSVHLLVVTLVAGLVAIGQPPAAASQPASAGAGVTAAAPPAPPPRLGELPERRTRTSTTRRNPDGTLTTTTFANPIHYRDGDGRWQPIDPTLRPVEEAGWAWRSDAGPFTARFGATAAAAGAVSLNVAGQELRLAAVGAGGGAGQVAGASVRYPAAWQGADLAYTVTGSGIKETIRLDGPDAPTSYAFRLTLPAGAAATRRAGGAWTLAVPRGPTLTLEAPTVTEAADPGRLAPPDPAAKPSLAVEWDGRELLLRLTIDQGWLRAPGRRFPVELDPTLVVQTIQPDAEDASFTDPQSTAFTSTHLWVGASATTTYRAALRFDLAGVPARIITDAKLHLYWDGSCIAGQPGHCGGVDHVLNAHRLTSAWTPASTGSQLTYDPAVTGSYTWQTSVLGNRWMTWPLTGLVQSWLNGSQPNHGLLLKRSAEVLNISGPVMPGRRYTGDPALMPKLEMTYASDAVDLLQPETVHANGAELRWTRYSGPSGAPFDRYEVHRSATLGFSPGDTTRLATIRDQDTTTWRDTTAAPSKTFYYKLVANTSVSSEITVPTPAAGTARKVLQPGPADGRVTYLRNDVAGTTGDECLDYGAASHLRIGAASAGQLHRPLLAFDLGDIPPSATVNSATLTVYHTNSSALPGQINLHRVTRAWQEGSGNNNCQQTGAIWQETQPNLPWTTAGGDFSATVVDSENDAKTVASGYGKDDFTVTSLVQQWVNGTVPNHGVLLKLASETVIAWFDYRADDDPTATARPKLEVTYTDGSAAVTPTVAIATPGPGAKVSGPSVKVAAATGDDRRVDRVTFTLDGTTTLANDTSPPFETTWNSTTAANASHTITATAFDDAGNQSTQPASVTVTADNTTAPTASVTSAVRSPTEPAKYTVSASAGDDVGVAKVEFYADDAKFAETSTAPYQATWDTLDPLQTAFDGAHTLTVKAYDTSGQVTTSAGFGVTVANTTGTSARAGFDLNSTLPGDLDGDGEIIPELMANATQPAGSPPPDPYEPPNSGTRTLTSAPRSSLEPQFADAVEGTQGGWPVEEQPPGCQTTAYCPKVTVTNTSGTTWQGSSLALWYRWYAPNGVVLYEGPAASSFPATLAPGASTTPLPVTINPPYLPPGTDLGQYRLRIDIYNTATGEWFAQRGNPPVDRPVVVRRKLDGALGLERYYQYEGEPVGGGMSTLTNVASGNMLLRWTPFSSPGRGLSTVLDLTYNALEDHSESPAGNNFSLGISGLTRLGYGLDIHPNKADDISGNANKWVAFTDGDGTPHRFTGTTQPNGSTLWEEPHGVNLYLRSIATNPADRRWALTRPDKVTFWFWDDGSPSAITDRNNNTLTFVLSPVAPGDDPGGPKRHVTAVTDAGGRQYTIVYYTKADAKKAHVRGKVKRITDHAGRALDFDYYEDGNLLRVTQRGGTKADGSFLADRSWVFTYTTPPGDGPAIPLIADRVSPDPKTPSQSSRLYSVRDPLGVQAGTAGRETTFAYYQPSDGPDLRWRLKSRTNRAGPDTGQKTSFTYDLANRRSTVTEPPNSRVTTYSWDLDGKVTQIVNPLNETTRVEWTPDFKVSKVTEPKGVATPADPNDFATSYAYNANGYLTETTDAEGNKTVLAYRNDPVDAVDAAGHLSLLTSRTNPKGVATTTPADDFQWTFGYDTPGNLRTVTDPEGHTGTNLWNPDGTLASATDANQHTTRYETYDANGLPTRIVDAKGQVTQAGYDADGLLLSLQDRLHAGDGGADARSYQRFFDYDSFRRLGRQSAPKSTRFERGQLIWTSADYDANDNLTKSVGARFGADDPGTGPSTTVTYDVMDRPTLSRNPDGETTKVDYDTAGRPKQVTSPKGVATTGAGDLDKDFATLSEFDDLDRVVRQTQHTVNASGAITATRITHLCYDLAGDLRSVTRPRANVATVTCPGDGPATGVGFTSTYTYDKAHRPLTMSDPLGHTQTTHYDPNGNVDQRTDANNVTTTIAYDERDLPIRATQPLDVAAGRNTILRFAYDAVGNRTKEISPRASDTGGAGGPWTQLITDYVYDELDKPIRIDLPKSSAEAERHSIHQAYDANGNLAWTSLPVATQDPAAIANSTTARTILSHFDPGWVRTSKDPANPRVAFDYNARGQQVSRIPEVKGSPGTPDRGRTTRWEYYLDGQLKSQTGRDGKPNTYTWDANNNLDKATQSRGIDDPTGSRSLVEVTYTGFDQLAKTRHRKASETDWTFTQFKTYDLNGNVTERLDSGKETTAGAVTTTPKRNTFAYDQADWLTTQHDWGTNATSCSGDQRITTSFTPVGQEATRTIAKGTSTCAETAPAWQTKQTTTWDWFDNSLLKAMTTKNGAGAVQESHDLSYTDPAGIYVNGNRTRDTYILKGPGSTACAASPCTATWTYDPRDRLIRHDPGHGATPSSYTLDESARQSDPLIRAGNVTTQTDARSGTRNLRYVGNQLTEISTGAGVSARYWYDDDGNLDCVTTAAGTQANCSPSGTLPSTPPPPNVLNDYGYDALGRLVTARTWDATRLWDTARYTYDALDRLTQEWENHFGFSTARTTTFDHLGLTSLVTRERRTAGSSPTSPLQRENTYGYDVYGHRLTMASTFPTGTPPTSHTYGYDPHGSVSLLLDEATGSATASYGYTPYGDGDATLSKGDVDTRTTINPYRYSAKRYDTGAKNLDMGARRFGPDVGRFLQQDLLEGALGDLGLAADPLTGNRYALAGGNPVSFVEVDGHMVLLDGGGGSSYTPTPASTSSASSTTTGSSTSGSPSGSGVGDRGAEWAVKDQAKISWRKKLQETKDSLKTLGCAIIQFGCNKDEQQQLRAHYERFTKDDRYALDAIGSALIGGLEEDTKEIRADLGAGRTAQAAGRAPVVGLSILSSRITGKGIGKLLGVDRRSTLPSCPGNSFAPGTLVVMADGTRKAIEDVREGDAVLATDPRTGRTEARRVTATIVGKGEKDLVELTIDTDGHDGDATGTVIATDGHPFWVDDEGRWVDADDLAPGDRLRAPHGEPLSVVAARRYTAHQRVHNLTVDGIHTYYVLAGDTPVLVHNTKCNTFGHLSPSGRMDIPNVPGVYRIEMQKPGGRPEVYVGKATDIHERVHGAFRPGGAPYDAGYRPQDVRDLDWMEMEDATDRELFTMEHDWIEYEGGIGNLLNRYQSPGAGY